MVLAGLLNESVLEGTVQPALATEWRTISPLDVEFSLRRGVRFHNGEVFDADSVVATFHAHRHPTPSAGGKGVLGPILAAIKVDDYTIRIQTAAPDAMLLRRLFFSSVYPAISSFCSAMVRSRCCSMRPATRERSFSGPARSSAQKGRNPSPKANASSSIVAMS